MTPRATGPISQVNSHHSTRSRTATSSAACSTAQPSPAENPARQRVKLIHGSAIKTDDPTRIVVLSDRRESKGRSRLHLIYGSAIKSHGKPCRFNYLLISNRR